MTKIGPLLIGIAMATFFALPATAAKARRPEHGSVKATINGAHISIDYGRPALRGRDLLTQMQPGQLWRIGADAPATLDSDKELNFGGTIVPKGKHILQARLVARGSWTLVISRIPAGPRAPRAKPTEVPMTFQEAGDSTELVTIQLTDKGGTGVIAIAWGRVRFTASFTPA